MSYAPKIILHTPTCLDLAALDQFVEKCLLDKVVLICVVGADCERVEALIDEVIVGDGTDKGRFIVTTSHKNEAIDEVLEFAKSWPKNETSSVQEVRLLPFR